MKIILLKKIIKHYLNKIYISTPILTMNVLNQIAHVSGHGFWAHGFQPMVSSIIVKPNKIK